MKRAVPFIAVAALILAGCNGFIGDVGRGGKPSDDVVQGQKKFSQAFTTTEDFRKGTYNGVTDDTEGQLQMTVGQSAFSTPYLWTPSSTANTITLIDTMKNQVIGTYSLKDPKTGEPCYNPSRTTVDFNWDVWVGCRGTSSYVNGRQGRPVSQVDNKVMKVSFKTGKVLLSVRVGNAPRALALDANNHLWVGASVDDTVWEIDGETGACLRGEGCAQPAIQIHDFPYGAVVDQDGFLWVVHNEVGNHTPDELTKIDTATGKVVSVTGPFWRGRNGAPGNDCDDLYGIAVDQLGDVWLGGFGCNDVVKVSGKTGQMIGAYEVGGELTRGVAIDLDGNVWAASSGTSTVTKLNGATGGLIRTVSVGKRPIGVAVDAYGHVWTVNLESDSVTKVNGLQDETAQTDVGNNPYTYSDMLGLSLRTVTLRKKSLATWRVVVDSGSATAHFTELKWSSMAPSNTTFAVRYRCSADSSALATLPWSAELAAPGPVDCAPGQRFIEVECRFGATGTSASAILRHLSVEWAE